MTDGRKRETETVTMWTVQAPVVLETLERDGISFVKKAYLTKKYGETDKVFRTAYDYFVREAQKRVPKPAEAESPVWMFADSQRPVKSPGAWLIKLKVPREELILFDLRSFERILSMRPLGDTAELENELRRQGVQDPSDVFLTPFYPVLREKIRGTWSLLFEEGAPEEDTYTEGAAWCLKEEWIEEKNHL